MPSEHYLTISLILFFIELLGILNAIHAILHARSPQGAIAWTFSLVIFPFVTVPLYVMLGRHRFQGYLKSHRRAETHYQTAIQWTFQEIERCFTAQLPEHLVPLQTLASELGWLPFLKGNSVQLLVDGQIAFPAMLAAIAAAQNYILFCFYTVRDDELGREFQRALINKAQQGIRVYFIFDDLGSYELENDYLEELEAAGVNVERFTTVRGVGNRFQINFRNHRKILVVDGEIAFLGGMNIGNEYLGKNPEFGNWRDTHLKLQGPAVQAVQLTFMEDWYWLTEEIPFLSWQAIAAPQGDEHVFIFSTGPADTLPSCTLFFVNLFNLAQKRLWIASPYFVPDEIVVNALQLAVLRGVDVRILMPEKSDHRLVQLASFSYYEEMLTIGAHLYRYHAGFMHQKVILLDDQLASIGTVNLDNRSFRLNFEITAFVMASDLVKQVENLLLKDFEEANVVQMESVLQRTFSRQITIRLSRLMAPLL